MTQPPDPTAPFLDRRLARDALYNSSDRLAQRTGALHVAKRCGEEPAAVIVALARAYLPPHPRVLDVGCGRGSTTLALADALAPSRLVALDLSPALLQTTIERASHCSVDLRVVCADFLQLPFPPASFDLVVAAFCLYHSPVPDLVVREIARCLDTRGIAVLVTKSATSYRGLDGLVASSRLDEHALARPSLYATLHSGNLARVAAAALQVMTVRHDRHTFIFDAETAAAYLLTSPKYQLPSDDADAVTVALQDALRPRTQLKTTSTVSYCVGRRRDLPEALRQR